MPTLDLGQALRSRTEERTSHILLGLLPGPAAHRPGCELPKTWQALDQGGDTFGGEAEAEWSEWFCQFLSPTHCDQ